MYVILGKDRSLDHTKENRFFNQCVKEGWPLVRIKASDSYSELHWDYISIDPDAEDLLDSVLAKEVFQGFLRMALSVSEPGNVHGDITVGWVDRVSAHQAECLAKVLTECFSLILGRAAPLCHQK